jgi:hypothetical protein
MVKPNSAGKENDNSTRFCVDFRKVNEITKKDAYPIPRIDDTFNTLSGAKYFSSVDMFSGYWQVELKEEDKEKTAYFAYQNGTCWLSILVHFL